jgi:chitin disaccharide deacetylase
VWMRDSDRAALLARDRGFPVGLHLNFTFAFDGGAAPDDVRERQLALTRVLHQDSWRRQNELGETKSLIAAALADQLRRFRECFGEPTHVDGHHHVHMHPAVLAQLPRDLPIRPPLRNGRQPTLAQRWRLRRFRTPRACIAFERLHPAVGGSGLDALDEARRTTIEVMVHPAAEREREALLSHEWRAAMAGLELGSYADLRW